MKLNPRFEKDNKQQTNAIILRQHSNQWADKLAFDTNWERKMNIIN